MFRTVGGPGSVCDGFAVAHVACFAQEQSEPGIQVINGRDGEGMKVQRPGQRLDLADQAAGRDLPGQVDVLGQTAR
jgi:hypothetical protein